MLLFVVLIIVVWGMVSVIVWQQISKKLDKLFDIQQLLFVCCLSVMYFDELCVLFVLFGEKKKVCYGYIDDDVLVFVIFICDGKMVFNDGENGEDIQWNLQCEGFSDGYLCDDDDEWCFLWLIIVDGCYCIVVGQEWDYWCEMVMDIVILQFILWMVVLLLMFVLFIVLLSCELVLLKNLVCMLCLCVLDLVDLFSVEKIFVEVCLLVEVLNQLF